MMGGSAVDLSTIKANPSVHAIMWVGYPGQASGTSGASRFNQPTIATVSLRYETVAKALGLTIRFESFLRERT